MENTNGTEETGKTCYTTGLMWWATLVVAVLAVPSFGFIVSSIIPVRGVGELVVFIGACWFCTYLGMRLMQNPKISQPVNPRK